MSLFCIGISHRTAKVETRERYALQRSEEALRMGLAWRVCEPDELISEASRHAEVLAARPIPSLMAVKQTIAEPSRLGIKAATERENAHFAELMGAAANADALAAFTERRGREGS